MKFTTTFIMVTVFTSLTAVFGAQAQVPTEMPIPAGSFIVNMGVMPQTIGNGLKPYGLLWALTNVNCPVHWVINPLKAKDGIDFSHAGLDYRGGPFIIEAQYRTPEVNAIIASWQAQGVVGTTTTSPTTVPVYLTFYYLPKWTMDKQNGSIAVKFFVNAGIPASAYGGSSSSLWKYPSELDCCDDIFVMPHADPVWLTHGHLYDWVQGGGDGITAGCKGGVWLGCHAGSALEDMFNPANPSQQTNFLSGKEVVASGAGPYFQNALWLWNNHSGGTVPYSYDYPVDPVMQFMGTIDATVQNGSEQIYIPRSAGWYPTTKVCVYDPDHPQRYPYGYQAVPPYTGYEDPRHRAAVLAYGPAFGNPENGKVMLEAAHDISKLGNNPASVAAQRAFFNFSLQVLWEKSIFPEILVLPPVIYADQTNVDAEYKLYYNTGELYEGAIQGVTWSSSCGGTFNTDSSNPTHFSPPPVSGNTLCNLSLLVEDNCGRETFDTHMVMIQCRLDVAITVTNPCYDTPSGGAIEMTPVYGVPGYTWSWVRAEGGSGSGSGLSITGLSAGTYTVTLTERDGAGCAKTFTVSLSTSPLILVNATSAPVSCPGGSSGAINTHVSGGVPPFSYDWADLPGTSDPANRSALAAGTYTLTVTDSKGCIESVSVQVDQPSPIVITPEIIPVACYGFNNGRINLTVTGGTGAYTYLWSDGNNNQNRTGLAPGVYWVTVTDANNCSATLSGLEVTQPAAPLTLSHTQENVNCYGVVSGTDAGSIDLTVTGGTAPYVYAWTGPGSPYATEDLTDLGAGIYTVTVTDSRNCIASRSVTITQPPPLFLSTQVVHPACPPEPAPVPPDPPADPPVYSDGAITLTVTGGEPPYSYAWTGPDGFTAQTANISELAAGTYTVVVTDANDCTATTNVILVEQNPNPQVPGVINH